MAKKICPYPFSRISLANEKYYPCCASWLTDEYYHLDHAETSWQSDAAIKLRQSILDGSFKYCKRDICNMPLIEIEAGNDFETEEIYINASTVNKIINGELEDIPVTSLLVDDDIVCNLACGSCRKFLITKNTPEQKTYQMITLKRFSKIVTGLHKIKFAGEAEFFLSKHYQDILQILYSKRPNHLNEVSIVTNGLLVSKANYEKLGPARELITELIVSMDAGDEKTYSKVRGGSWKKLLDNLNFMLELRAQGKIKKLMLGFVVQKENYHSIPDFIKLAESLGVDEVYITVLHKFKNMGLDYDEHAVHISTHPEHQEYISIYDKFRDYPNVYWRTALT